MRTTRIALATVFAVAFISMTSLMVDIFLVSAKGTFFAEEHPFEVMILIVIDAFLLGMSVLLFRRSARAYPFYYIAGTFSLVYVFYERLIVSDLHFSLADWAVTVALVTFWLAFGWAIRLLKTKSTIA